MAARLAPLAARAQRLLLRVEVRLVLSACIIVSLLPYPWVGGFDGLFLAVFGVELVARALALFRADAAEDGEWQVPSLGAISLLVLDLVALLSFLPLFDADDSSRFLRLFRLTRMLLLIGYWAPLARDVWAVLARGERARQIVLMGAMVLALSFTGALIIEYVAERSESGIDFDGDGAFTREDRSFLVLLWWAFRQVQDPGNMISTPVEVTAMLVSLGLTVFGLFLVSFLIGLGTDVVRELMELSRLREPGLRGHTVIVHLTGATQQLLLEITSYYRKLVPEGGLSRRWLRQLAKNTRRVRQRRYVVVGEHVDPPDFMRRPELAHVIYRPWTADDAALLRRTDMRDAQRVMLLANHAARDPDAETLQTLLTIAEGQRVEPRARRRPQLLIAEILDESAIPAARTAIAGNQARAFVVPTERLLALFMASAVRQRGCVRLIEALLASHGHEIYTCYFDLPGLAYTCDRPLLAAQPVDAAMGELLRRAAGTSVIPVGLLLPGEGGAPVRVAINPRGGEVASYRGFVAIARDFAAVRDFAESLRGPAPPALPESAEIATPTLRRAEALPLRRALICGFRSATVSLVEAMVIAEPEIELLVLVGDEAARAAALDHFDAHSNLVRNGLLPGRHGTFEAGEDGLLRLRRAGGGLVGRVQVAVGDFTSSRQLVALPLGFGHAADLDAVVLLVDAHRGSDASVAKALMKLEALLGDAERRPHVLAELADAELALRLRSHYRRRGRADVSVYSVDTLRSLFLFQAVVVPSFDAVYAELLGPWGQSLLRMVPRDAPPGRCTFGGLAARLRGEGAVLLAIEVRGADEAVALYIGRGPEEDGAFEARSLVAAWVITADLASPSGV